MMKLTNKMSVLYQFNAIIMGMLLINFIIGLLITQTAFRLVEGQIEKRGADLAAYIGVLSSNDILLEDRYALFDRINKTRQNSEDVRYIIVADSGGTMLAHTFNDYFPQGLAVHIPVFQSISDKQQVHTSSDNYRVTKYDSNEGVVREVVLPIEDGSIGYVRVGLSEKTAEQLLGKAITEVGLIMVVTWLVAAAGATYLAFVIIKPLQRLTRAAEQIGHGNFCVEDEVSGKDEVSKLSIVFNDMVRNLRDKRQENQQLLEELQKKEALRAELIMKLFAVQEEERKRISRELHDETGQLLASLLAYMKLLLSKLADESHKNILVNARDVATNALNGLRKIAVELRPPVLDDLGLSAAMIRYIRTFSEQQGLPVHVSVPEGKLELGSEISLALYRIVQESLTNIAKHAEASEVTISLVVEKQQIHLTITDNGMGMEEVDWVPKQGTVRLGVFGMTERAELLGGTFQLHSSSKGTTICVTLPTQFEVKHGENKDYYCR